MAENVATADLLPRAKARNGVPAANRATTPLDLTVTTTNNIEDAESVWRALEADGIESPGQSYDFTRVWVRAHRVALADQLYVVGRLGGVPAALLPLQRRTRAGVRQLSWFAGAHVGCNAPLVDKARLAALSDTERAQLWQLLLGGLRGADLIFLRAIPTTSDSLFSGLGTSLPVETLYRSEFDSWDACNTTQRSKSRRKHDRQQGEKLDALGKVGFDVVGSGDPSAPAVLDTMFRQRAARFAEMGIDDPFAPADVARFYRDTVEPGSGVAIKLHVLRLDEQIVAVRYNVVFGDKLFCLISSMSVDPSIQGGSPGKQCLLRVMQTVFDEGFATFDMGAGFTDEKRHWCNTQTALAHHYLPLTLKGRAVVAGYRFWQSARARIKSDRRLLKIAKGLRGALQRTPAKPAASEDASD